MLDETTGAPRTLLITLTGKDRPGVTSLVFDTLAQFGVEVLDIEQIVLRRRLILGLLVSAPRDWKPLRKAMEQVAADLEMTLELDRGSGDNRPRPEGRSHVTVLGTPLKSAAVAAIAGRIADTGANIDRIERMARYPITAIDLHVSGVDPEKLRDILAREAAGRASTSPSRPAEPAAPRHAADRDGRRLHPDPGRGHRDAGRARRVRGRGRPRHRAGDARRDRLRRRACASGSRCWRGSTRPPSTRCTTTWCSPPEPAPPCAS